MATNQKVNEMNNNQAVNGTKVTLVWRGKLRQGQVVSSKAHGGLVYYDVKLDDGYVATVHHDTVVVEPAPVQASLDLEDTSGDNRSDGQFATKPEPVKPETKPLPKSGISKKEMNNE